MAKKYTKIGTVWKNKTKEGTTYPGIKLGSPAKDPKYARSVEIIVRDGSGTVLARQVDGAVRMYSPKEQEGKSLPENLSHELVLVQEE